MTSFLEKLAKSIVASQIPLQEAAIVLPNKRAKRMLLLALAKQFDKPIYSPAIFTIDDFIETLSPFESLDKVTLMVRLYELYRQHFDAKPVDDVFTWAPAFVDDISEMDMQLADVVTIFQDLSGFKEFESKIGQDELSQSQQEKIALYNSFADLYVQFGDYLRENGWGYPGMIYRDCAEHISEYAQKLTYKHFVFAGFHVLNPAELTVVAYIKEHFDTQFYFDIDSFYCDFKKNERFNTAHFLKKICSRLDIPENKLQYNQSYFKEQKKEIEIVGTSKTMNQIYYAIHCLEQIKQTQGNLDNTALVLADEQLLVPFLSAYGIKDVNVTMGYPFKMTPAYTLLTTLFEMYHQAMQFAKSSHKLKFQRRHLVTLFRSPLVRKYLFTDEKQYESLMTDLDANQKNVYGAEDFKQLATQNLKQELIPSDEVDISNLLDAIVQYLKQLLQVIGDKKDATILQVLVEQLDTTKNLLQPLLNVLSFYTLKYLVEQQVSALTVPIKGDATNGLQVMGLLETRTMDFKNVIMLSVNEGTLPSGIRFNSLIPFDFKFNGETLENYLYKDQVYAYHFFRLLQRAEKVVLLYDNDSSASLAEKSRFITQLEFEVQEQQLDNIHLSYPVVNFPYLAEHDAPIVINKTAEICNELKSWKFSASALNSYIRCPMKFYLSYLCGIKDRETFKEKIGMDAIGTVTHACFQEVFDQIKKTPEDYKNILMDYRNNIETKVRAQFLATESLGLQDDDMTQGRVLLSTKIVEHHVKNYLEKAEKELEKGTITILGNELSLECKLKFEDVEDTVIIKGFVDRVQLNAGQLEVLDYKTGKVEDKDLKIKQEDIDNLFEDPKYEKFVQLLFYAILCKYNKSIPQLKGLFGNDETFTVRGAIIALQHLQSNSGYLHFAKYGKMEKNKVVFGETFNKDILDKLEKELMKKLQEILDEKMPFTQTEKEDNCRYCDFKYLCRRGLVKKQTT